MTVDSVYPNLNSASQGGPSQRNAAAPASASASQSSAKQDSSAPAEFAADVPHARMKAGKFDLSPYCNVGLIDSIARLTSPIWMVGMILRPGAKIMWRSLFLDDHATNITALLSALTSNTPITEVPLKKKPRVSQAQQATTFNQSSESAAPIIPRHIDLEQRSWTVRLMHFFCIGLPLAALVGLIFGVLGLVQGIVMNIINVFKTISRLYHNSDDDIRYYKANPNELPERRVAIDAALQQIVAPYVSRLVARKVRIVGPWIAPKAERYFGNVSSKRVNQLYDQIEKRTSRRGSQNQPQSQSKRNL